MTGKYNNISERVTNIMQIMNVGCLAQNLYTYKGIVPLYVIR